MRHCTTFVFAYSRVILVLAEVLRQKDRWVYIRVSIQAETRVGRWCLGQIASKDLRLNAGSNQALYRPRTQEKSQPSRLSSPMASGETLTFPSKGELNVAVLAQSSEATHAANTLPLTQKQLTLKLNMLARHTLAIPKSYHRGRSVIQCIA